MAHRKASPDRQFFAETNLRAWLEEQAAQTFELVRRWPSADLPGSEPDDWERERAESPESAAHGVLWAEFTAARKRFLDNLGRDPAADPDALAQIAREAALAALLRIQKLESKRWSKTGGRPRKDYAEALARLPELDEQIVKAVSREWRTCGHRARLIAEKLEDEAEIARQKGLKPPPVPPVEWIERRLPAIPDKPWARPRKFGKNPPFGEGPSEAAASLSREEAPRHER